MTVQVNGDEYSDEQFQQAASILRTNFREMPHIRSSEDFMAHLGRMYSGDRDIYDVLGYDDAPEADDYRAKYRRQDLAKRVVELPANDTWKRPPEVAVDLEAESEDDFDDAVQTLEDDLHLWNVLNRLDIAAGLGEYAVLFIGFKDGQPLDEEVNADVLDGPDDVAFMTPYAQDHVIDWELGRDRDRDPGDPRYNKPVEYTISFTDDDGDIDDEDHWEEVHWTRVLHVAEGRVESDLKGTPRLEPIYNLLEDRLKVQGSSAEMFWSGADRKYQFNVDTDDTERIDPDALEDLDQEVQRLVHDMQQYVKTFNTDMNVISGEEVDPSGILDQIDKTIAATIGIPKRVLLGSERGELASTQDRSTWFGRVESRQNRFAEPMMLRPLLNRFQAYGVLPEVDQFDVRWPNLFELTESEKAEVWSKRATAAANIAPKGNTDVIFDGPEQMFEFMMDGEKPDFEQAAANLDPEEAEAQFDRLMTAAFSEGDEVESPGGTGVVVDILTGNEIPSGAPDADTVYVVALVDKKDHRFYTATDLEDGEIDVDVPGGVDEAAAANLRSNDWSMPPSWRQSEQPSRAILLKAWAGMGGTWRGCHREMGTGSEDFCAAMKDEVLGTTEWRGGWANTAGGTDFRNEGWNPVDQLRDEFGRFVEMPDPDSVATDLIRAGEISGTQLEQAKQVREQYLDHEEEDFNKVKSIADDLGFDADHRIKTHGSIAEKAFSRKNTTPGKLGDIFGARIFPDEPDQIEDTLQRVREEMDVITIENKMDNDGYYRAVHVDVELGDGRKGELQIKTKEMNELIEVGHKTVYKPEEAEAEGVQLTDRDVQEVRDCLDQRMNALLEGGSPNCTDNAQNIIQQVS